MSILEIMTIREAAEHLRDISIKIANEKGITKEEAWDLLMEELKIQLGG
ncbi:hypothetical protein [Romboutsia sp. Marseille-P6047]|nr:hypothetical protein [Romboutsia sp. Marseille-P6047]